MPLLQQSPPVVGAEDYHQLKKVPTFAEYFAQHQPKTKAGVEAVKEIISLVGAPSYVPFVAPGTPPAYTLALADAFHSAMAQKGARTTMLTVGLSPGYVNPTQMAAEIRAMVKGAQILNHYANYTYQ